MREQREYHIQTTLHNVWVSVQYLGVSDRLDTVQGVYVEHEGNFSAIGDIQVMSGGLVSVFLPDNGQWVTMNAADTAFVY